MTPARRRRRRLSRAAPAGRRSRSRSGLRLRHHLAAARQHLILTETAILALFALSLDLILGYAGIISLGHAAFFGVGAYAAGLLAKYGIITEPIIALLAAGVVAAALGFVTSFLVLRGSDLTRLMVTLGVSLMLRTRQPYSDITGGADGLQGVTIAPIFGLYRFDLFGHTAYVYCLVVLFVCSSWRAASSIRRSACRCGPIKGNPLRAAAIGIAVNWRLVAIYTLSAGYAGIAGALLAQTQAFASLDALDRPLGRRAAGPDHRRHRLSLWRHHRRADLPAAAGLALRPDGAILAVLDRPAAGRDRAGRPRAHRRGWIAAVRIALHRIGSARYRPPAALGARRRMGR